jgi:hypothetical protein
MTLPTTDSAAFEDRRIGGWRRGVRRLPMPQRNKKRAIDEVSSISASED